MSLKGYEWLREGKVVMSYFFKDERLIIWEDVTEQELADFKQFLQEHSSKVFKTEYYNKEKKWENFSLFSLQF